MSGPHLIDKGRNYYWVAFSLVYGYEGLLLVVTGQLSLEVGQSNVFMVLIFTC